MIHAGNVGGVVHSFYVKAVGGTDTEKNTASSGGGGVYLYGGEFTMSGGTIKGNTAATGGGVYNFDSTFNMSGSATVDSNNDVYLLNGATITVGALTGTGTVATITPGSYEGDDGAAVQVLDGDGVSTYHEKFKVSTADDGSTWEIDESGILRAQ